MTALQFNLIVFLGACFGVSVLCNLAAKRKDICSEENSVKVGDLCYVMIKNKTWALRAKESCNSTGGRLWETSDLDDVFERIRNNPNFTGQFWVDNTNDEGITIDRRILKGICPTITLSSYDKGHGLQMTINYHTSSLFCATTWAHFICKYEIILVKTDTNGQFNVLLPVLIVTGILVVFITILAIICRRTILRFAAPTSNAHKSRVYDIPLEETDNKENETLLEEETKPKEQHIISYSTRNAAQAALKNAAQAAVTKEKQKFPYSIGNAAQAALTRKNGYHDKDTRSQESQEIEGMQMNHQRKTSKKDGSIDNEKQNVSYVELPTMDDLDIVQKSEVFKVTSMLEPPKSEETETNIAMAKPNDIQQRELKTDSNNSVSEKTKNTITKSTSKSSFDISSEQNVTEKYNTINESQTDKKEDKENNEDENTDNDKDIKKD